MTNLYEQVNIEREYIIHGLGKDSHTRKERGGGGGVSMKHSDLIEMYKLQILQIKKKHFHTVKKYILKCK